MSLETHSRIIKVLLALYFAATWSSMAGMEIFGWTLFLMSAIYVWRQPNSNHPNISDVAEILPWKTCIALLFIVSLGLLINGTRNADWFYDVGTMRWMFLFFANSFALALCFPTNRGFKFFVYAASLIAIYAIIQSFTGIDLVRPGSYRAVQPLYLNEKDSGFFRSAGFFGSPMLYSYIAGQHACFFLAMALLTFSNRKTHKFLFWGSAIAFTLVAVSIVTTFTRGAWIAMLLSWVFVVWLSERRLAIAFTGGISALGLGFFGLNETFRLRILSLFNLQYESNSERIFLWKINWEMFKDYPILGIGYQENESRAAEYAAKLGNPDAFTGHAHNNYLQMLSGTGFLGFATYMFLISYMLWLTWRLWKSLPEQLLWPRAVALGALGAQIFLHIGGLTEANFKAGATNHNVIVVWSLVVALTVINKVGLLNKLDSSALLRSR